MKLLPIFLLGVVGCTTPATKLAIENYNKSQAHQTLAFNNATRVAKDQMLLNLIQYIRQNPQKAEEAVRATWAAREQIEVTREQFLLAKVLSLVTTGQYLYNQQGALNAWFGAKASMVKDFSDAVETANKAAGVTSVKELIPGVDSTTRPSSNDVRDLLNRLSGKSP